MICIVMVTHNNGDTVSEAIKSLISSKGLDYLIIVDNASRDQTKAIINEYSNNYSFIKVIYLGKNYGFTGGVTAGVKVMSKYCRDDEYFGLFNPDAVATEHWLINLLKVMDSDNSIGMAQSLLVKPSGDVDSAGGFINSLGYPIEFKPIIDWRRLSRLKSYGVGYAKGAAALIRRKAYEEVGGFDDRFFFYYDETDLSYRLRRRGYKIVVVPNSIVYHVGLGSRIPNKEYFVLYYMERNHLLFLWKNFRDRFIPALAWSLIGAVKERVHIRRIIRLRALKDSIKLIRGKRVYEPFRI
jgi:GT2 family glycosyltransferase